MKRFIAALVAVVFILSLHEAHAKAGDTTYVQTFTFGSKQDSTFFFPTAGKQWNKILMYYTLKCNSAQNPACGEWDYLTYTYLYKPTGTFDSTSYTDSTYDSVKAEWQYFEAWNVFEVTDRFELGRYITPYGINLSLGEGFTWVFDVSDYAMLLKDSVHLKAGNWQELLDMKFAFIEGTSPREPYKIENVWRGNFPYGTSKSIEEHLNEREIMMDEDAASVKMKVRVTGHGFGGNDNCAEFCPRNHSLLVDGTERWKKLVWRDNCAYNPVYPQGGTWIYNRANWCPGAEVETYDVELTPYVEAGKTVKLDYNVEPYTWNGQGSQPYYATETQLIYYKENAFKTDAAIEAIISPSSADLYSRKNPVCAHPQIIIKNYGTEPLKRLTIKFGQKGGERVVYIWEGELAFGESEQVDLGAAVIASPLNGSREFEVELTEPNGATDENPINDKAYSYFEIPKLLPNKFIVMMKPNNAPEESEWTIKDNSGTVRYSRSNMEANKVYLDTVELDNSCFLFHLTDAGEDGLNFFANNDGVGYVRLVDMNNRALAVWKNDFGAEIWYQFNTGYTLSVPEDVEDISVSIYPNPSAGVYYVDVSALTLGAYQLQVTDLLGRVVWQKIETKPGQLLQQVDISHHPAGNYFVRVIAGNKSYTSQIIKQ